MSFPVVNGVEVAVPPPAGYQVDFSNPETDGSMVRNAYWIFGMEFAFATAFLGQRMYTNGVILRKFMIDDYLILFAWILSIAAQSFLLDAYRRKLLGVHAWEMPVDSNTESALLVMCTTLTYIPTTILSKLTLCFFYYRLSPARWYQYSVYVTGIICTTSLVGIWFSVLFACKPIAAGWDVRLSVNATCINRPPIYITQAAFGCITDVMLLILPIPTVVGLQMSTRQKLGVLGLFAIGSITLITSVVRLVLLLPSLSNPDQSWSLAEGCLWVIIEANLLIMCGSLPTLRVFLKNVAPRVLGDKSQMLGRSRIVPPHNVYGKQTQDRSMRYADPRYLNSGTLGDLRDCVDAALTLIEGTWNATFDHRNSDQFCLGKLYARQEVNHAMAVTGGSIPNLKGTRKLPQFSEFGTEQTDYHMAVDHESAFTCTQCASVDWMRNIAFDRPGHRSVVKGNISKKKHPFKPFTIRMPGILVNALTKLYDAIDHEQPTEEWIKSVKLGTNIATGHIYPLYHGTCRKSNFMSRYMNLWLYPMSSRLLEAASKALEAREPLMGDMVDGRYWVSSQHYPDDEEGLQGLGGIYTDSKDNKERFIPLTEFCAGYLEELVPKIPLVNTD
ncbi:hypothetical protein FGRA07_09135 [Fusarium graminearum]|nr:hypothetical protein FGRA07_09135 [Fusarium graminearum]